MTDDPKLFDVVQALSQVRDTQNMAESQRVREARELCAMLRAFLGEDAERKEVSDHTRGGEASADNATAAEADPPWLDEAARAMDPREWDHASPSYRLIARRLIARHQVRAVLRVANAQPVSDAEVEAATNALCSKFQTVPKPTTEWYARIALEAAAKVRGSAKVGSIE